MIDKRSIGTRGRRTKRDSNELQNARLGKTRIVIVRVTIIRVKFLSNLSLNQAVDENLSIVLTISPATMFHSLPLLILFHG